VPTSAFKGKAYIHERTRTLLNLTKDNINTDLTVLETTTNSFGTSHHKSHIKELRLKEKHQSR
jgi:hypothetical protein